MKKFLLLLLILGLGLNAMAQLVGGVTYPINGTANGTTSFASLRAAIAYLQANGVSGTGQVILEFTAPYDATLVDAPAAGATKITIPNIPGTSAAIGVTIRPAAGFTTALSANVDGAGLIEFDGASYVTIDGRQGGTGTAIGFTLENLSTTTNAGTAVVKFLNDAHHNTLRYNELKGGSTNTASTGGVVYFGTSTGTVGNSNNTITNNNIGSLSASTTVGFIVLNNGTAGVPNHANSILNNNIRNYTFRGLNLLTGLGNNWVISGNSIYSSAAVSGVTSYGILVSSATSTNFTISNNYIGGSAPQCGGTAIVTWGFNGIYAVVGAGIHNIENNIITNISAAYTYVTPPTGVTLAHSLIYVSTTAGTANVINNHLGSQTENNNIILGTNSSATVEQTLLFYGIYVTGTGSTAVIKANDMGGITLNPVGVATARYDGYYINTGVLASLTIEKNTIGGTVANSIQTTGTGRGIYQISLITGAAATVEGNIIRNISSRSTAGIVGLYGGAASGTVNFLGNKVYNLKNIGTAGGNINGAYIPSGNAAYQFTNNIISLENTNVGTENIFGVRKAGGTGNLDMYFNTIHISGGILAANRIFYADAAATFTLRNNIFSNGYSNGSFNSGSAGTFNTDYNLYIYPEATTSEITSNAFGYGDLGRPATPADLFANDSSPYFMSIAAAYNSLFRAKGTPIAGITKDIGGNLRSTTVPSLGAYEANTTTLLPVNISAFTAKLNNNKVALNWTVGTEVNVNRYEIERSSNSVDFVKIGQIAANGAISYSLVDDKPLSGINYYRLTGVDNDGTLSYFDELRSVKVASLTAKELVVYPNPIKGNIVNVGLGDFALGTYNYQLADLSGKVYDRGIFVNTGAQVNRLPITDALPKGIYILSLTNGSERIQSKLIK